MIQRCLVVLLSILLISCTLSGGDDYDDYDDWQNIEDTEFEEVSSLFDLQVDGSIIFETNDPRYWSSEGFTLWTIDGNYAAVATPFNGSSCTVSKSSGHYYTGYGILFCSGKNSDDQDAMYTLMINTRQQYAVGKAINGEYISIQSWTGFAGLRYGYGASNTLKVSYNEAQGIYEVYLNNEKVFEFNTQPDVPVSGGSGYIAVISPYDKFPDDTVRILYNVE